jgi:hypothetical protein
LTRRLLTIGVLVALVGVVLVLVGRWERSERAEEQSAGIGEIAATVGPLDDPTLTAYRYFEAFQCLAYRRGTVRLALELCVDWDGRVVEAIDRRSGSPTIWSLRDDPTRSTVRVDRCETDRLLIRMGVPRGYLLGSVCIPG